MSQLHNRVSLYNYISKCMSIWSQGAYVQCAIFLCDRLIQVALLSWLYPCDVTTCINIISLVQVFPFPFLSQLFYLMVLPTVMTTDQGKEFHNRVNDELVKVFGIKHRLTAAYHPQANGLDECLNQDSDQQPGKIRSRGPQYVGQEPAGSCLCIQHCSPRFLKVHSI